MYVGKTSFVNLAEPLYEKIIGTVDKANIVTDLTNITEEHIPSATLLKFISDKVDNIQNVSIIVNGIVESQSQLPPC